MAEIRITCPHCKQGISCDELWAGHQLQCPSCQGELTVPQSQAAPPPAPAPVRVGFQPRGSAAHGPPVPAETRLSLGRPGDGQSAKPVFREIKGTAKKKASPMKWVTIGVAVVAVGAGVYFGWPQLKAYQDKVNEKRRQAEKNSDGGEVGHIANVYDVLDKTDPDREEKTGTSRSGAPRQPRTGVGKPMAAGAATASDGSVTNAAVSELPVIPPVWTLELATAKIPDGKANGKISGTNFVAETARVDVVANAHVLSLRQGTGVSPDREILVYLHPKPGESLAGYTLNVSKDMKGTGVPQVTKRWKTNPRFAPQLKSFSTGYAMKLEFGQITDGEIQGKIFVALPDAEKTVVAGVFKATTSVAGAPNPAATAAPATPAPAANPEFEKRYGVKR